MRGADAGPGSTELSRRSFVGAGLGALGAMAVGPALAGCGGTGTDPGGNGPVSNPRLSARPQTPTETATPGATALGLAEGRDGLLFVPDTWSPEVPAPLLVALHGAGGSAGDWQSYAAHAAQRGIVVLAPDSRFSTWDIAAVDYYGPDVDFLDAALAHAFARILVDPDRIGLAGFSDGASYALSLGLSNGDVLAGGLIGHSAGFLAPAPPIVGRPRIWMSHGTGDPVLPLPGARAIEQDLRGDGYEVTFVEFAGGHSIPSAIAVAALDWLLAAT